MNKQLIERLQSRQATIGIVGLVLLVAIYLLLGPWTALGFFAGQPDLAPEWRLFVITGFLGGLTTFSSFSGESVTLLQRGEVGWALAHTALHLFGSLLLCAAGFATWRALRG